MHHLTPACGRPWSEADYGVEEPEADDWVEEPEVDDEVGGA